MATGSSSFNPANPTTEGDWQARVAALETQLADLKARDASKNRFISILSHDLRTPIVAVIMAAQRLRQDFDPHLPPDGHKLVEDIETETRRIMKELEALLEWYRITDRRVKYRPEEYDLQSAFRSVIELNHLSARNKHIQLRIGNPNPAWVFADPYMLHTILRNLVSNALKFTPEGGSVELSHHSLPNDPEFIAITVTDTGVGMDADTQAKIFQLGAVESTPGTANEPGRGLGLSICRELVELSEGEIDVDSAPGHGTTFRFTLPRP